MCIDGDDVGRVAGSEGDLYWEESELALDEEAGLGCLGARCTWSLGHGNDLQQPGRVGHGAGPRPWPLRLHSSQPS